MNRRAFAWLVSSLVLAVGVGGCGAPPQIGADRDAFKAVDALYTAISLRDPGLIDGCETRLNDLRDAGKLPKGASESLGSIIGEARRGKWEPAAERLARFMEGQRR